MAGTRKLDALTITQARKAFQRAKFILEQRQKALSEAESSADAAQLAKVTQAEIVLKSRDFLRNFLKITLENLATIWVLEQMALPHGSLTIQSPLQPFSSSGT